MHSFLVCLLLLTGLVYSSTTNSSIALDDPNPVDCSNFDRSCQACALQPGCGYCDTTRKCIPGNAISPSDPDSCGRKEWNKCTRICGSKFVCRDCLANSCGWCESAPGSTGNCIFGDRRGPLNYTCGQKWIYGDVDQCPSEAACSQYAYCGACVNNENCGWCDSTHRCVPGGLKGPNTGTCENYVYLGCPKTKIAWWVWLLMAVLIALLVGLCIAIILRRRRRISKGHYNEENAQLILEDDEETRKVYNTATGSYSMNIAP